jgi:hypothetical protein
MTKSIFQSKTAALAFLTGIAGFWGPSREWVASNPTATLSILAMVSLGLRLITKDKVTLWLN